MKKILVLIFTVLMFIGCESRPQKWNRYEVLLTTGDTVYIDAYDYGRKHDTYIFREQNCKPIVEIVNPIYIKQIKDR